MVVSVKKKRQRNVPESVMEVQRLCTQVIAFLTKSTAFFMFSLPIKVHMIRNFFFPFLEVQYA